MSTIPPPVPYSYAPVRQTVVVTDVDMTIGAMCRFMVKWAIASIPAVIILWIIMLIAFKFVLALFAGILGGAGRFGH